MLVSGVQCTRPPLPISRRGQIWLADASDGVNCETGRARRGSAAFVTTHQERTGGNSPCPPSSLFLPQSLSSVCSWCPPPSRSCRSTSEASSSDSAASWVHVDRVYSC